MKIPDKIYVTPVGTWDTERIPDLQDNIYIRKDTLLEWAKEKAELYKGTANIRRSFEMMIRKIESL